MQIAREESEVEKMAQALEWAIHAAVSRIQKRYCTTTRIEK